MCWSPYVAAELARVATREYATDALARDGRRHPVDVAQEAMANVRPVIDSAVQAFERRWRSPSPGDHAAIIERLPRDAVDPHDVPVLAGALACRAGYLLSRDKAMFPHGGTFQGSTSGTQTPS